MIRSENEYKGTVRRLRAEGQRLEKHRAHLESLGLKANEVKRALDPLRSFHAQLAEEVESYERLKRREFGELVNFEGLGELLIALRIAAGLTQRQLATRLGVSETQVSRDERNEYHGVTVERAGRVLAALHAELHCVVTKAAGNAIRHAAGA